MEVSILSICSDEFAPLAKFTIEGNKRVYCEKHGNKLIDLRVAHTSDRTVGWERIERVLEHFSKRRGDSNEWCWVMGVDTMIMNFQRRLEEFADPNFHFIIAGDFHVLNADSYIVRNTPEGRCWLEFLLARRPMHPDGFCEQQAMIDWHLKIPFAEWIKIVPQAGPQGINAYQMRLCLRSENDPGQWHEGDFLVHWPGTSLEVRLAEAEASSKMILY